jgi:hypothetical protein
MKLWQIVSKAGLAWIGATYLFLFLSGQTITFELILIAIIWNRL